MPIQNTSARWFSTRSPRCLSILWFICNVVGFLQKNVIGPLRCLKANVHGDNIWRHAISKIILLRHKSWDIDKNIRWYKQIFLKICGKFRNQIESIQKQSPRSVIILASINVEYYCWSNLCGQNNCISLINDAQTFCCKILTWEKTLFWFWHTVI